MENEILELRRSGFTYEQIIEKLGCSKSTVSYYCRKNGEGRFDNSIKLSTELVLEIQKEYDNGYSLRKLSSKYGINRSILSKYIVIKKKSHQTVDERKKSTVKKVIDWRKRIKLKLIEYKGGKCQIESCGYNKSVWSLGFHHIDSKDKDFSVSGKTKSFDKMKKELDKCILVCSNCHGEIHEEINKNGYSNIVNKIIK